MSHAAILYLVLVGTRPYRVPVIMQKELDDVAAPGRALQYVMYALLACNLGVQYLVLLPYSDVMTSDCKQFCCYEVQ